MSISEKILVTGAEGFIGSHLVESLVKKGYNVKAFVLYNSFSFNGWLDTLPKNIKDNFEIFYGDLRDKNSLLLASKECKIFYNLGALISIPYSYQSPESFIQTNVLGTLNLLEIARQSEVDLFVQTSTSEVYGSAKFAPMSEDHPLSGQSPYSASKIASDQIAYSFYSSYDLPVTILRPFNTFGPRQSARAIIPTIISQLINDKLIIELGNTSSTRDFNYIEDTINGFIKCLNSNNAIGETINIGSGHECKILDLVKLIAYIFNKKIKIKSINHRLRPKNSEVDRLIASNVKAKKILNWSPKYTGKKGLERGLIKTIEWFKDKENLSFYKNDEYKI